MAWSLVTPEQSLNREVSYISVVFRLQGDGGVTGGAVGTENHRKLPLC